MYATLAAHEDIILDALPIVPLLAVAVALSISLLATALAAIVRLALLGFPFLLVSVLVIPPALCRWRAHVRNTLAIIRARSGGTAAISSGRHHRLERGSKSRVILVVLLLTCSCNVGPKFIRKVVREPLHLPVAKHQPRKLPRPGPLSEDRPAALTGGLSALTRGI